MDWEIKTPWHLFSFCVYCHTHFEIQKFKRHSYIRTHMHMRHDHKEIYTQHTSLGIEGVIKRSAQSLSLSPSCADKRYDPLCSCVSRSLSHSFVDHKWNELRFSSASLNCQRCANNRWVLLTQLPRERMTPGWSSRCDRISRVPDERESAPVVIRCKMPNHIFCSFHSPGGKHLCLLFFVSCVYVYMCH